MPFPIGCAGNNAVSGSGGGIIGPINIASGGDPTAPDYSWTGAQSNTGIFQSNGGRIDFAHAGVHYHGFSANNVRFASGVSMGWSNDADPWTAPAFLLVRDADQILALKNGSDPQSLRVYNTDDGGGGNYERGTLQWTSNILDVRTEQGGSGSPRQIQMGTAGAAQISFFTNGTYRWDVGAATGHLLARTNNTYDVGADAATSPRDIFVARRVLIQNANRETLAADKTLAATDEPYQSLDPGGANRNVDLPPEAAGLMFIIANRNGGVRNLVIRDDTGATTIATLGDDEAILVVSDGTGWVALWGNQVTTIT